MKVKKRYTVLVYIISMLPVCAADGTTLKDATDNWLKEQHIIQTDNWLGTESWLQQPAATSGPPVITGNPTSDPIVPLSNETAVFFGLGLAYGCYVLRKRKYVTEENRL